MFIKVVKNNILIFDVVDAEEAPIKNILDPEV